MHCETPTSGGPRRLRPTGTTGLPGKMWGRTRDLMAQLIWPIPLAHGGGDAKARATERRARLSQADQTRANALFEAV